MKHSNKFKRYLFSSLIAMLIPFCSSCSRQEYCAECWEFKPLITLGKGDVSFCSDDAVRVNDFIYDYESWGWYCEFRD